MDSLGERVRYARTEAGLTPEQLAARCGVELAMVMQWETVAPEGHHRPNLDNLRTIARETGFLADWLLTGQGPKRIEEDRRRALVLPLGLTDEQADLLYVWGGLTPELKANFLDLMKASSTRGEGLRDTESKPSLQEISFPKPPGLDE